MTMKKLSNLIMIVVIAATVCSVVFVVVTAYQASETNPLEQKSLVVFVAAICMLFVLNIFQVFVLRIKIVSKLSYFNAAVNKILKDGLSTDLDKNLTTGNDEISKLAASFNKLLGNLRESQLDVQKKIADQTEQIRKYSRDLEEQKEAILNVLEDVGEEKELAKKQSQELEKFRQAVENASDTIIISNSEGKILYVNPAVTALTGFKPNELVGKKAGTIKNWGGQMDKEFYKKLWKTVKEEKRPFVAELNNKTKHGENYIAATTITPIVDEKNEIKFIVQVQRDITKEKEISKMKTEFISLASHQLRTPLAAVKWFLEMLLDDSFGEMNIEQTKMLTAAAQSNKRMIDLVNNLLNISRIESGRIIIAPREINLAALIDELLAELTPLINEKEIEATVEVDEGIGQVLIDPDLTREVYRNLLTNSIKYTPEKGKISIQVSKNKKDIVSRITDTGVGIPAKEKGKIFTRFHRGTNVINSNTEGTGLGLYLSRAIVESSGGHIWFESHENSGTTFWFTIPASGMQAKEGEVSIGENQVVNSLL